MLFFWQLFWFCGRGLATLAACAFARVLCWGPAFLGRQFWVDFFWRPVRLSFDAFFFAFYAAIVFFWEVACSFLSLDLAMEIIQPPQQILLPVVLPAVCALLLGG